MRGIINVFVYYWIFFRNKHIILPVVFRFQFILFSHTSPLKKIRENLITAAETTITTSALIIILFFSEGMTYLFSVKT